MTHTVAVPVWLLAILVALAAWALLVLLLVPGMRWYFRRRVNAVIQEINTRLRIELPSFKLTRRRVLIDRLSHDPQVEAAAAAHAKQHGLPLAEAHDLVDRYAHEIVPSFNAYLYFRIGYAVAKGVARLLYRVRLGYADEAGIAAIDPRSTVVFVMNHRSNMDYVLVAFLAAERMALSYAVGEWARVWPLQTLIRAMGAYFVRRNSGDPLYRAVLQRYVQMATEAGVCQAMFPEGGLTLDGALRPPKFGLLDYMVKGFGALGSRDVVFIPVGINYDRVLEDRTQLTKLDREARRPGLLAAAARSLSFVARNVWLMLTGRWHRFGYACVNFGSPVSLRAHVSGRGVDFRALADEARKGEVAVLGRHLMEAIGRVIPVVPVALVARVARAAGARPLSELEIKSASLALMRELEARGAHIYIPRLDQDYAIGVGLRMLTLRHLLAERDGLFHRVPENDAALAYYANSIAHLAEPAASTPVVVSGRSEAPAGAPA